MTSSPAHASRLAREVEREGRYGVPARQQEAAPVLDFFGERVASSPSASKLSRIEMPITAAAMVAAGDRIFVAGERGELQVYAVDPYLRDKGINGRWPRLGGTLGLLRAAPCGGLVCAKVSATALSFVSLFEQ